MDVFGRSHHLKDCASCNGTETSSEPRRGMFFYATLSVISDPLRAEIIIQHPEMRGAHRPVQSQPGYIQLQQGQHNHLQEIMTSSNKCQRPKPKDGSCTLQNDHPQVKRRADSMPSFQKTPLFQRICKTSPLLMGLLKGNELAFQDLASPSPSSAKKADTVGLKSKNPSVKGHMSQKVTAVMVSSRSGQTRTMAQDPATTHSGHFQPNVLHSSLGTDPSAYNYSAADVGRLPSNIPLYRTNAEVLELINERVAFFRARRHKPDHNCPNFTSVPRHSTTFSSDKKDVTMHDFSCSLTKRSIIVAGQACEVDLLKGTHANPKLTSTSDKNDNIPAFKHSKGTETSSVEVGPNEVIDKCITVGLENQGDSSWDKENVSLNVVKVQQYEDVSETEEPVQQHREHKESQVAAIFGDISHEHSEDTTSTSVERSLNETFDKCITGGVDLSEQASDGRKFVCAEDCDVPTFSSEKVNNKHVTNIVNINPVTHSLSALKELVVSFDGVVTNAEMDNVSEVRLQQYWDGDGDNIHVFASTENPQIMLEVAATCTRHDEESPTVIQVLSPRSSLCSLLPQEDRTSWTSIENKLPGREPVCEVSSNTKHTAATDQENTSLKPEDIGSVQCNVTNLSIYAQLPREQGMDANKQKNAKGMQSYKATCKEVHSNFKQRSSMHENVPLRDDNREEQLLSHSSSRSVGETVTNNHGAPSLDKKTFSVSVLKVPQYDDVSDAEGPMQQHGRHKESQFAAFFEDISDDENLQTANTVVETPIHQSEGSLSKVKSHVQMESISCDELIPEPPQNCCCPYYIETVTGFEQVLCPKCDEERLIRVQTNGSQSPSIVLKKKDESDDGMDDWLAVPLKVDDITERGQVEPGDANHEGEQIGTPNPVPGSASPLAVLDTTKSSRTQVQTEQPGNCYCIPPPEGMLDLEVDILHSSRNPSCESDSCETEDSCDYMPTQGRNYLTVSQQAWKNLPAPLPCEHEDKRTQFHLNQKRRRQKSLTKRDKSNLGSDSEDENDSGAKVTKKRKKPTRPRSEDIGATSFHRQKRHSSEKDDHCETVEERSTPEQLSSYPQELSVKNLSEDRTELVPSTETEDSSDDANYLNAKRSCTSSSDSGDDSIEEKRKLEQANQQRKQNPPRKSQVGQAIEAPGGSTEPPQSKETKQGLKLINADAQTGPAPFGTNREITSKGNHAANKAHRKDKTHKKARRAARIYSDSSETEDSEDAFSDVSDSLHVNKHINIDQMNETKDGTHHVQQMANLLMTSKRDDTDDKVEKDHVSKKAKTTQLSETEDSEDDFSDTPDGSTLQKQSKSLLSHKEPPDKHPRYADSTSPPSGSFVVNRLYVQESQSNEPLQLSKHLPIQTLSAGGQPCVTANTNAATAATRKKADSHWNRHKEASFVPTSRSSNNSHAAVQFPSCTPSTLSPKQPSPASRQQLSRSYSSPSTSGLPRPYPKNPSFPTAAHSSALDKVKGIWKNQFHPISVHKKASLGTEDNSKNDVNPIRETEPGPRNPSRFHRRRHSSYKSETPLMKKTKFEAKERTRDINYNPQRQHSHAVADHYKWKNPRERRESEGSWRRRTRCPSSPELEWD